MRSFIGDDAYVSTLGVSFERKRVTREMMDCLGTFFDLEQIVMTDCVVDNNDFAKIAHYTGVKSIYLQDTNLSDVGLKQFGGLRERDGVFHGPQRCYDGRPEMPCGNEEPVLDSG